ncbi:MAG: class I SAM-dependent methyltransferase [Burkholderiales bacterium]
MSRDEQLRELETGKQENELIERYIQSKAVNGAPVQILEAGCGQKWELDLDNVVLTGVDLDPAALDIRKNVQKDLHEAIQGDLCSIDLPAERFDVIYNSFVLEHIEDAGRVLQNFTRWLKPGGIVVLKIPDPDSVRGFITRITPHWFHVFYYRYLLGARNAGKPGYAPYTTYYHPVVSRRGIREFCEKQSLVVREECGDGGYQSFGRGAIASLTRLFVRTVAALSFGKLTSRHTNLLFILEKR